MKDSKNNVSMNLNLLAEKSAFEKLEENLKHSIFGVLYVLLKNQTVSIWMEFIFIFIQMFQLLSFPLSIIVSIKNKKHLIFELRKVTLLIFLFF